MGGGGGRGGGGALGCGLVGLVFPWLWSGVVVPPWLWGGLVFPLLQAIGTEAQGHAQPQSETEPKSNVIGFSPGKKHTVVVSGCTLHS